MRPWIPHSLLLLLLSATMLAQPQQLPSDSIPHMERYSDLAVHWLRDYLRIDTTNPPGNEGQAAAFLKTIFDREGIENQVFDFASGRSDIWARVPCSIEASRCDRPIILPTTWTSSPASLRTGASRPSVPRSSMALSTPVGRRT